MKLSAVPSAGHGIGVAAVLSPGVQFPLEHMRGDSIWNTVVMHTWSELALDMSGG